MAKGASARRGVASCLVQAQSPWLTQEEDKLNNLVPWRLKGTCYSMGPLHLFAEFLFVWKVIFVCQNSLFYAWRLRSD